MSVTATIFSVYVLFGLIAMVVALATAKHRTREKWTGYFGGASPEGLEIFLIALLWPVWVLAILFTIDKDVD